jgi:DUF2909 family protein
MSQVADQRARVKWNVNDNRAPRRGASIVPLQPDPVQARIAAMDLIRIVIVALLVAIIISLGTALYHLSSGKGDSQKLLRALTVRIALSVLLFILLMVAWRAGLITPRGVEP